jgi:hypothetical protein
MRYFTSLLVSALLISAPAHAQTDWLSVARSALEQQNKPAATSSIAPGLSNEKIAAGLKEALNLSAKKVVAQLGKEGGFTLDPKIRIPLPAPLAKADSALKKVGMGALTKDLETRMNRAAELATPKAQALFVDAIKQMTVKDARSILSSQQDAATVYLRKTTGKQLETNMKPIVGKTLADAGAVRAYDQVAGQYAQLPFVSGLKTNLNDYVATKAVDGIFYYVAQEEAAIRKNPAKRTTELLRAVFGAVK